MEVLRQVNRLKRQVEGWNMYGPELKTEENEHFD